MEIAYVLPAVQRVAEQQPPSTAVAERLAAFQPGWLTAYARVFSGARLRGTASDSA